MSTDKLGCGNGLPCIYVSRNKWIPYEEIGKYRPPKVKSLSWKQENTTLFIMIASFRDKLCPRTLFNAFTKAKYPDRITVGVVQQNLSGDLDCIIEYCNLIKKTTLTLDCPHLQNIRVIKKDASESKGPTWARALGSTLLQNEEFCMQIDSHMDFVSNWDTKMLEMWASTENEYAILSTYVTDASELKNLGDGKKGVNGLHEVPHVCMITFDGANGLIRNWGTKSARNLPRPKLNNAVWGAGLSFSKCHAERKVPYDPHTPHIFDGEEFSRAMRYWTSGYDIYTPSRVYVVHDYQVSQTDPTHMLWFLNTDRDREQGISLEASAQRLKMLLGLPSAEKNETKTRELRQSKYGLGDRRTIQQMIQFSGVDTFNRKILDNRCGNIEYVPFIEHSKGVDYIPKFDPVTEKFRDERDSGSIYHPAHPSLMTDYDIMNHDNIRDNVIISTTSSVAMNMDTSMKTVKKESLKAEESAIFSLPLDINVAARLGFQSDTNIALNGVLYFGVSIFILLICIFCVRGQKSKVVSHATVNNKMIELIDGDNKVSRRSIRDVHKYV